VVVKLRPWWSAVEGGAASGASTVEGGRATLKGPDWLDVKGDDATDGAVSWAAVGLGRGGIMAAVGRGRVAVGRWPQGSDGLTPWVTGGAPLRAAGGPGRGGIVGGCNTHFLQE
jgi:hypothetical protein